MIQGYYTDPGNELCLYCIVITCGFRNQGFSCHLSVNHTAEKIISPFRCILQQDTNFIAVNLNSQNVSIVLVSGSTQSDYYKGAFFLFT